MSFFHVLIIMVIRKTVDKLKFNLIIHHLRLRVMMIIGLKKQTSLRALITGELYMELFNICHKQSTFLFNFL
jgi:hypothetical protein